MFNPKAKITVPEYYRGHSHTTKDGIGGNLLWLRNEPNPSKIRSMESVDGVRYTSYKDELSDRMNYVVFVPYDIEFDMESFYIKSEEFGVAGYFNNEHDRTRYLNDPLTSKTFQPCTEEEVEDFMEENGFVWVDEPTRYYGGTLDGVRVTYSISRDYLEV